MSEFKKIVRKQNQDLECPYCGAVYNIHMMRCPYCDSVNEFGAEEDYLDDLEDIRTKLEDADDLSKELYTDTAKRTLGKAVKVLIVIAIILAFIATVVFAAYKSFEAYQYKKQKEELAWQRENFVKLDEWYENGDFESVQNFIYDMYGRGESHDIWNWEHYQFYQAYSKYSYIKQYVEESDTKEHDSYDEAYFFDDAMELIFDVWDIKLNTAKSITKTDYEYIMEYRDYTREVIKEFYNLTDEELDAIKSEVIYDSPSVGVDRRKCDAVLEKLKSEM